MKLLHVTEAYINIGEEEEGRNINFDKIENSFSTKNYATIPRETRNKIWERDTLQ